MFIMLIKLRLFAKLSSQTVLIGFSPEPSTSVRSPIILGGWATTEIPSVGLEIVSLELCTLANGLVWSGYMYFVEKISVFTLK